VGYDILYVLLYYLYYELALLSINTIHQLLEHMIPTLIVDECECAGSYFIEEIVGELRILHMVQ
jgi:hypothetical protein